MLVHIRNGVLLFSYSSLERTCQNIILHVLNMDALQSISAILASRDCMNNYCMYSNANIAHYFHWNNLEI